MKKSILNLGKALNKKEQREVNGGIIAYCPHGSRALVACIGGELLGYCRDTGGVFTISLGPCLSL